MVCASGCEPMLVIEGRLSALSMVIRDMGNGVTRILHADAFADVPPPEFFEGFRASAVPSPLVPHVRDAVECAALVVGVDPLREYVGGFMRALTEDITELFIW